MGGWDIIVLQKCLMNLDMSSELTISHNDSRNLRLLTTEHMEPMTPLSLTWHDLGNKSLTKGITFND